MATALDPQQPVHPRQHPLPPAYVSGPQGCADRGIYGRLGGHCLCQDAPVALRSDRANSWFLTFTVVVLALLAVWIIGWESSIYGEDLAASHNQGLPGTFTVRKVDCGRSCHATGDFVSEDGRTAVKGIGLQQVDARDVGDRYPGQYFAKPHRLVYPLNPSPPIWGLLFAIGSAFYLVALGLSLVLRPGRRFWAVVWRR